MTPELVMFQVAHLATMPLREPQERDFLLERAAVAAQAGPAFTGLVEGRPVACGGIVRLWPGVGEAWTVFSPEIVQYRLWLHRLVRHTIPMLMTALDLRRLHTNVVASSSRNCAWIEALGFTPEGRMVAFGPDGSDYLRYAWVRGRDG